VGANPLPGGRIGTLVVGGQSVAVSQTGIAPSTPNAPSGPSIGVTGFAYSLTASGSGDGMEYRFDWGDGRYSAWSDGAASVAWSAGGTYAIRAQGRNRYCPSLVSAWSAPLNLTIYRPEDKVAHDFDHNGVPDLIWQDEEKRRVVIWFMGGPNGSSWYLAGGSWGQGT